MTTKATKTNPYPKGLGLDSPRVLSSAAVLVGCWFAVVAVVALVVAVVVAVVALLVLGLMWCCKGSFNMKEWLSRVFTTAGLGQLNLFSSTLGMV